MRENKPIILTKKKQESQDKPRVSNGEEMELRLVDKKIGDAMTDARNKMGLSRKDLAHKMKKNVAVIDSWERGEAVYDGKIAKELEGILGIKFNEK